MSSLVQRARPHHSPAPIHLDHSARARTETAIERLIALLDQIDGGPGFESVRHDIVTLARRFAGIVGKSMQGENSLRLPLLLKGGRHA